MNLLSFVTLLFFNSSVLLFNEIDDPEIDDSSFDEVRIEKFVVFVVDVDDFNG